jgi:hypothetical protein
MTMTPPTTKFIGSKIEAEKRAEEIVESGGLAWIEADYSRAMSGHEEYMGHKIKFFDAATILERAAIATTRGGS